MAKYGTFLYGSGVLYGSTISEQAILLYKVNTSDPSQALMARHLRVVLKYTSLDHWSIDTVRLLYANKEHVVPKYLVPVDRNAKRTKVTLKYTGSDYWAVDSLRLVQRHLQRSL